MHIHDKGYKLIYTNHYMLKHLMQIALGPEGYGLFDWSTLRQVKNELIDARTLIKRQSDIVWSVALKGSTQDYALIFLENQSDVDKLMPVRLFSYVGLSLEDILQDQKLNNSMRPMIFPIVIYNGSRQWNAPQKISKLLAKMPADLKKYDHQFKYMLLDLQELIADNKLPDNNLAAIQFKMDAGCSYDEFTQLLDKFIELTQHPKYQSVRDIFNSWLKQVILPRNVLSKGFEAIDTENIMQTQKLLYETKPTWSEEFKMKGLEEGRREGREQGLEQGLEQGRKEGIKEGLEQGKADMLLEQLQYKFKHIPDSIVERIKSADHAQIKKWSLKFVDAKTLNEVFDIKLNGH